MGTEELVKRCKEGERDAQAVLYGTYSGKMLALIRRIVGTGNDAEDLLHDGFIIVFTAIGTLREPDNLEHWMGRIMTNLALKYVQSRKEEVGLEQAQNISCHENDTHGNEEIQIDDILKMVDSLPDGYRHVFKLSVLEGLSHAEIAGILGIRERSSSSQLLRARRKLQEMIKDYRIRLGLIALLLVATFTAVIHNLKRGERPHRQGKAFAERRTATRKAAKDDKADTAQRQDGQPAVAYATPTYAPPQAEDSLRQGDSTLTATINDSTAVPTGIIPDSIMIPSTPLPDALYVPKGDVADNETATDSGHGWLLSIASAAGQASDGLLPTVLSVVSHTAGSGTRLDIETWQELTHYLTYDVGDNLNPLEREALLRIASIYNGKIYTKRTYEKPLQIGLNFSKRLSDRWSLDFGLRLTRHTTRLLTGESDTTCIDERQRTMFVGVPVSATYSLWNKGRWTLYGTAGMALDLPFYGQSSINYNFDNAVIYHRNERPELPRWQWSVSAGVGIGYEIAPNLQLYVSPKLTWYIPNGSRTTTQWQDKPWQLSLPFGLRVLFK